MYVQYQVYVTYDNKSFFRIINITLSKFNAKKKVTPLIKLVPIINIDFLKFPMVVIFLLFFFFLVLVFCVFSRIMQSST